MTISIVKRITCETIFEHDCENNSLSITLSLAILNNADLRYANLSNADLFNADLSYADLRYANLTGAIIDK